MSIASRYSARRWSTSLTSRARFRSASIFSSQASVVLRLPLHVWFWWMLPSGSTRPLQPIWNACSLPSSSSFSADANSWGRSEMLKPASRAICWTTSPTRRSPGLLMTVSSKA